MASKNHIHKYHRLNDLWHCGLNDCTHFMPKNVAANVAGKASICWKCEKKFIMIEELMVLDKPVCRSCQLNEIGVSNQFGLDMYLAKKGV